MTITDEAASTVNGWQLTWTWPNSGESVTQLWTVTQSGTAATVANASYNATIGANGATVNFGFTGSDSGQTPAPAAFHLNGAICSNN